MSKKHGDVFLLGERHYGVEEQIASFCHRCGEGVQMAPPNFSEEYIEAAIRADQVLLVVCVGVGALHRAELMSAKVKIWGSDVIIVGIEPESRAICLFVYDVHTELARFLQTLIV